MACIDGFYIGEFIGGFLGGFYNSPWVTFTYRILLFYNVKLSGKTSLSRARLKKHAGKNTRSAFSPKRECFWKAENKFSSSVEYCCFT